jgi:hypothetical protein
MTAIDILTNVLAPVGVGAALGFPAGAFAGWRARLCMERRKAT